MLLSLLPPTKWNEGNDICFWCSILRLRNSYTMLCLSPETNDACHSPKTVWKRLIKSKVTGKSSTAWFSILSSCILSLFTTWLQWCAVCAQNQFTFVVHRVFLDWKYQTGKVTCTISRVFLWSCFWSKEHFTEHFNWAILNDHFKSRCEGTTMSQVECVVFWAKSLSKDL